MESDDNQTRKTRNNIESMIKGGIPLKLVRVLIKEESCGGPAEAHKTRIAEYLLIKIDAFHVTACPKGNFF